MPPIEWSQAALRDLTRLHDFLAQHSPDSAKRSIQTIRQGIKVLASHPEIGRPMEDLPMEFREWVIECGQSAYVVFYRFDGKNVVHLAVRHGREAGY